MEPTYDNVRIEAKVAIRTCLKSKTFTSLENLRKLFGNAEKDLVPSTDQAFRDIQQELIAKESSIGSIEQLITLSIKACRKDLISHSIPVVLLSDIFDLLTLDACQKMFTYVENHVMVWKEDLFFASCKNILLRMCNDLLRRLPKSKSTVFCGRILLFLAKFFPFSERSGLNVVGEFNMENVTEFGSESDFKEDMSTDDEPGKIFIDYSLYCKFWSLQEFFKNPNLCYDRVQWKHFCSHASSIIATFEGLKLEQTEKEPDDEDNNTNYFSKYLTNQRLLDLQLYDVNFRRFVLVQFMILFQYLNTTVRFKTNGHELTSEQKVFIQNGKERVQTLLVETPPDGEDFGQIVNNILTREEHWNCWKNDGCPEFRKALPQSIGSGETSATARPRPRPLGDIIKEARGKGVYDMGNSELTKLWNLNPNNLEACKAKERDFLPTLEDYFASYTNQSKAKNKRDALLKDGYAWRALRLLARRTTYFFVYINMPIRDLTGFLDIMVRRIASAKNPVGTNGDTETVEGDDDLLRQSEESADPDGEFQVQNIIPFKVTVLTVTQFHNICEALKDHWSVLAAKLHFQADEIEYIRSHNPEPVQQVSSLLNLWFEEDDDSTLENFLYILEGLNLVEGAEQVKIAIEQNKNLTTDTSNSNE